MVHLEHFFVLAAVIFVFGIVSRLAARFVLTGPIVFVAAGMAFSDSVAEWLGVTGLFHGLVHTERLVHLLGEVTLIVVLFTDAMQIRLRSLLAGAALPLRLLLVGMPLTLLLGGALAWVFFGHIGLWPVALLAAVLTPTDAALGQAVVANPRVPLRIRQGLSAESGLNDGIVVPLVLVFACLAGAGHPEGSEAAQAAVGVAFTMKQVLLGPLVGAAVGALGAWVLGLATRREWMEEAFRSVSGIALALIAYAVTDAAGGNGFIGAFVAGLVVGNSGVAICSHLHDFAEAESQLLVLTTFFLVGLTLAWEPLLNASGAVWLYAVLSLTVVRMVPVAIAMLGLGLRPKTVVFVGWFGPRGLASVLFAVLIIEQMSVPHADLVVQIVFLTVLLSVVLHGVTAAPWAAWYARRIEADPDATFERGQSAQGLVRKRCLDDR